MSQPAFRQRPWGLGFPLFRRLLDWYWPPLLLPQLLVFLLLLLLLLLLSGGRAQAQVPIRPAPDSTLHSAAELMELGQRGIDSLVVLQPASRPTLATTPYLDSLLAAQAAQGRWAAVDSAGRAALRLGIDYPTLRRYLGQAALARARPAEALRQYDRARHANSFDSLANYGLALAYLQLNQPAPAALLARSLPDSLRRRLHLRSFQPLTAVEVEAGGQFSDTRHRGPSAFLRLGVSSRLSPRFSLTQNFTYFGQDIELPDPYRPGSSRRYPIRQNQYHVLLGAQLAPRWRAQLGYHFLESDLGRPESHLGQLAYAALTYHRPYYAVQAGFFAGTLTDTARTQADLRLTVYPLGSLRLYGFGRASVVHSAGRRYPNGVLGAGGQLRPRLWLEAFGGLGQVPVLAEVDGTYVYNLLDPVHERAGASLLLLLPHQLSARLAVGTERRRDAIDGAYYALYSLSTTLVWTW